MAETPYEGNGYRVVVIGGGTGLSSVLRGLKHLVGRELADLCGVVTVSDDGGSSGRLRREFGVLPPGDIRNCLAALANDEDLLTRLFQYRFVSGEGLTGHSFGNLFLTALTGITGDFYQAILTAEDILSVKGSILPATLTDVRLEATGVSGKIYQGESVVGSSGERLSEVRLEPSWAPAFPPVLAAIRRADLILLGPGSLYTSILPNLLIPGVRAAVEASSARVVLCLNLMTQPGETDGMRAGDHLVALSVHVDEGLFDTVLVNNQSPNAELRELYEATGAQEVSWDRAKLEAKGLEVIEFDLLEEKGLIRHDSAKLNRAVLSMLRSPSASRRRAESDSNASQGRGEKDREGDP